MKRVWWTGDAFQCPRGTSACGKDNGIYAVPGSGLGASNLFLASRLRFLDSVDSGSQPDSSPLCGVVGFDDSMLVSGGCLGDPKSWSIRLTMRTKPLTPGPIRDPDAIYRWKHPKLRGAGDGVVFPLLMVGWVGVASEGIIRDQGRDVLLSWRKRAIGCEQDSLGSGKIGQRQAVVAQLKKECIF